MMTPNQHTCATSVCRKLPLEGGVGLTTDVGAGKGKALTASVKIVHASFVAASEKAKVLPYDVLDLENGQFDEDFAIFHETVSNLDRNLAAIIVQVRSIILHPSTPAA